ncbi:hypothetical protein GNI_160520 [Gregarina niphandrodes]|uniref:Uncharacterized protein n=1 Tax=Gregarina niphandrodes TaxID=110365 RepID=A0A023AZ22_GRENI|nr:hypothetical protein GNI_160520 [Gregarina niphandrodes]EZG43748.1 hypothetical protein GNI_160520 [Gregarina niphandrodes]|eukprot:XP_011134641.1 hypothetical protein GNI_160520 [Gregarina niphandrodes]
MRGPRSCPVEYCRSLVSMLAGHEAFGMGLWGRSLFFQGLAEDRAARDLERRLWDSDDMKVLEWFERQVIYAQGPSVGAVVTHGMVEEYEQRSETSFTAVLEWLVPRFWSESKNSDRASAVVSRLREAYKASVLPESWFACQPESLPSWAPRSIFQGGLRSAATVAYWAYYLDTRDAMSPEQRLWNLSILARWSPAQALIHAFSDMKEHFQSIRDDREDHPTAVIKQALGLWCKHNGVDFGGATSRRVTNDLQDLARQLTIIRNGPVDSAMDLYESRLGKWVKLAALEIATSKHHYCSFLYRRYRDSMISTYFADLIHWKVPESKKRFPVACPFPFSFSRVGHTWLRYAVRLEEQFVRRLIHLLIEEHVVETGHTHEAIVWELCYQKSFRFSAPKDKFNQLYDRALNDAIVQVSIERAFDRAWKLGCAAITTMYDVSAVTNAPLLAQFPALERTTPESFTSQP